MPERPGFSIYFRCWLAACLRDHPAARTRAAEESVSVALEEIEPGAWMDQVYKRDILEKPDQIYKKPGYTSV
jgi:hypothetical protein